VNAAADAAPDTLRLSLDAKATVKVGPFARGGTNRVPTQAADHDLGATARVTPVGILLPQTDELFLYAVQSRVTSDCLADILEQWWTSVREQWPRVRTLVINLDNGPESHSGRTQFMARLVSWAAQSGLTIRLAYYPPYHSKYNPIERCWGALERHWNGSLLDSSEAIEGFMASMKWKGQHPHVTTVSQIYRTGVRLSRAAMQAVEQHVQRQPGLRKWCVDIPAPIRIDGIFNCA
jgi:Rhodopirellula transposase DDE domain